jgi:CheY-like chemotaxis protein
MAMIKPTADSNTSAPYKYQILVVDDNEPCAKVMMWTLEALGQKAQIAFDGKTALSIAKSTHNDLILLDIGLPGMNGYEICQEMRKDPALKNTFIAAQTGWGESEHRERSKAAGFDCHLVKPINMATLEKIISTLDKARLTPEIINKSHTGTL